MSRLRSLVSTTGLLVLIPVLSILTSMYIMQPYKVSGQSMESTLYNGDSLLVDKIPATVSKITANAYIPNRGDIVIITTSKIPGHPASMKIVKRVIGLPGDHVVVNDGKITIYNSEHPSGYNPDEGTTHNMSHPTTTGFTDIVVPAGKVFVCGDNRPNSTDSRDIGPVDAHDIVGKLLLRTMPINSFELF